MDRPLDALPAGQEWSPALRTTAETYANQGGLLGAFTYALVVLETDDEDLAAAMASIPTNLFVTSALHDDAIDEADGWGDDRKRRLNERVTLGDLVFTDVVETAAALLDDVDLAPVLETVRRIGTGQLREETVESSTATFETALERLENRGAVWGDLAVALAEAVGGYSRAQRRALRAITTNVMFVLTVVDDVEDLPDDVENGVANVLLALYDGDLTACNSPGAAADAFLESGAPRRLEGILAERRAELEAAARDLEASLDRSNEAVLGAVVRALSWYCEAVCSAPIERIVPPARQRDLRERLAAGDDERRRCIEAAVDALPFDAAVDSAALANAVADLPAEPLADAMIMFSHATAVAEEDVSTSLDDALERLERRAATP